MINWIYVGISVVAIIIYFCITLDYTLYNDMSFLNPIRNYNKWKTLNWFGISVITLILNIIWFPYVIIYWIYKLFRWLFTVGRN